MLDDCANVLRTFICKFIFAQIQDFKFDTMPNQVTQYF